MQRGPRGTSMPYKKTKFSLKSFFGLLNQTKPAYWLLGLGLFFGLISTGAQLAIPKMASSLINSLKQASNYHELELVIGLFIGSAIISALSGSVLGFFGQDVVAKLRNRLWGKLLHLQIPYFDNTKSGEMTSRLVNDTTQIKDFLASAVPSMVTSILTIIGALFLMIQMDWRMTAIMVPAIPLVLLVMMPLIRLSAKVARARQDALATFTGDTGETLSEIRLVKLSNAEPYEEKRGADSVEKLYRIGLKEAVYASIANPLIMGVMMALVIGVLIYGASRVSAGTMTMGTMFAFLMYLFQIMGPAGNLGNFFSSMSQASGSTERVRDLLNEPEEDLSADGSLDIDNETLKVSHVNFAYDQDEPIIQDLSFEAKPNTVVAFAGPSGGGKSTIFSLLERYYEPDSGKITIGDQNVTDLNLANWREQIAFVSQDSAIMAGTIRYNLTYGLADADIDDYTDDDLWNVLTLAYADKFVHEMPDELDTTVGERGVKLSGGQRQRIAIARAFLRDSKILMLDEATASLDSESEAMVQKAIDELMKGRTTLVIAHRLSTIVNADTINFIEKGHVSGSGTHQELQQKSPLYREYVKTQFNQ